MAWHGYILIHELPPGWTTAQRALVFNALETIGKQNDPQPAKNNQRRDSLDGKEIIIEAEFEEAEITRAGIVQLAADVLALPYNAVNAVIGYTIFAEGEAWNDSRLAAIAYIDANAANWRIDEV